MLVIRFLLWPGGDQARERELATIAVANDGTGDGAEGNYSYAISHQQGTSYAKPFDGPHGLLEKNDNVWKRGRIEKFPRRLGIIILAQRILNGAFHRKGTP